MTRNYLHTDWLCLGLMLAEQPAVAVGQRKNPERGEAGFRVEALCLTDVFRRLICISPG